MQAYRSRSITDPIAALGTATALAAALLVSCGGDDAPTSCGPGDAPADGITLSGSGVDIHYTGFVAGPNNDCPEVGNPSPPTSLTIVGNQVGSAFPLTLCVRRPDKLGGAAASLGEITTASAAAVVEDVSATVGSCTLSFVRDPAPSGTLSAEGVCGDGADKAGFAVKLDGDVSVKRTCGDQVETLRLHLSGRAAVTAQ